MATSINESSQRLHFLQRNFSQSSQFGFIYRIYNQFKYWSQHTNVKHWHRRQNIQMPLKSRLLIFTPCVILFPSMQVEYSCDFRLSSLSVLYPEMQEPGDMSSAVFEAWAQCLGHDWHSIDTSRMLHTTVNTVHWKQMLLNRRGWEVWKICWHCPAKTPNTHAVKCPRKLTAPKLVSISWKWPGTVREQEIEMTIP